MAVAVFPTKISENDIYLGREFERTSTTAIFIDDLESFFIGTAWALVPFHNRNPPLIVVKVSNFYVTLVITRSKRLRVITLLWMIFGGYSI